MSSYLTIRILKGLLVVVLISIVTFGIMRLIPGDPVQLLLGEGSIPISQEQIAAIRARWGLDLPLHEQYLVWAGNLLRGDFGTSLMRTGVPVRDMIFEAIPITAYVPRWFGDLPLIGRIPPFGLRSWQGWILPVIVIATEEMAVLMRITRGSVLELLPQDFVRTARSKGLAERAVLYKHIVANTLLPVITVIGFRIAFILSGTIIVETVFALPGIGRLFVDSVLKLDYQVVQSLVVVFAVLVVVVNLLTDLVYALVDPRIRIS